MAAFVQAAGAGNWTAFTLTGVAEGSALFFVGVGQDDGNASVDSFTITGGIAPDGQALVQDINGGVVFFAWWNSVAAGDYQVSASLTDISNPGTGGDGALLEFSGWTGTETTHDGTNSGFTSSAGTSHNAGSVTLSGPGIVLAGARYFSGSGTITWTDLTHFDLGSREAVGHGYFGSGQAVSGAWTSVGSVQSQSAIIAIPESSGGGEVVGTGGAQAGDAVTSGQGARQVTGSGDAQSGDSSSAGVGTRVVTGSGGAAAGASTTAGAGSGGGEVVGTGGAQAGDATSSGVGLRVITGSGQAQSGPSTASGLGLRIITGSGDAVSGDATTQGNDEPVRSTPPSRTLNVPAEDRTYLVEAEDRIYRVS